MYLSLDKILLCVSLLLSISFAIDPPVKPGDECQPITLPCNTVNNTECLKKEESDSYSCICNNPLVTDFQNKRCLHQWTKPGDSCVANNNGNSCSNISNTECTEEGSPGYFICKCTSEFATLPYGRCLKLPSSVGDECYPTQAECSKVAETSCEKIEDEKYICKCEGDLVTDLLEKTCLTKPTKPGDFCHPTLTPCTTVASTVCELDSENKHRCECVPPEVTFVDEHKCLRKPIAPGDSCHQTLTPCPTGTNTTCEVSGGDLEGVCKCIDDYITLPDKGVCITAPQFPGDVCDPILANCDDVDDTDCKDSGGGSFICMCNSPLITDPNGHRCLEKPTKPGQVCDPIVASCNDVVGTECTMYFGDFICKCQNGLVTDITYKRCIPIPQSPGDACEVTQAPCPPLTNTTCSSDKPDTDPFCNCVDGYVTDSVGKRCLKKPNKPGQSCEPPFTNEFCPGAPDPTSCEPFEQGSPERYCKCTTDGYATDVIGEVCFKIPTKPGENCLETVAPCTGGDLINTTCSRNNTEDQFTCNCNSPLVTDVANGKCIVPPLVPGNSCDPVLTPCDNVNNTTCSEDGGSFTCICIPGLITLPVNGVCITAPQFPGDVCDPILADCISVNNTKCKENEDGNFICMCDDPLVTDPNGHRCLEKPTKPGQVCDPIVAQCNDAVGTECAMYFGEYICLCQNGLITDIKYERCISLPQFPGDPCEVNQAPCPPLTNTTCSSNIPGTPPFCRCADDHVTDGGGRRCLKNPSKPGQPCEPGFTDTFCPSTPIPTSCKLLEQGSLEFYCKCSDGYATDIIGEACFKIPTKPGDSCHVTVAPCTSGDLGNTTCSSNSGNQFTCNCNSPLVTDVANGKCLVPPLVPGDPCDPGLTPCDNVTNTVCKPDMIGGNVCLCDDGLVTIPELGRCISRPTLPGQSCYPALAECDFVPNAETECKMFDGEYICKCKDPFITDTDANRCLTKPTKPGEDCDPKFTPCSEVTPATVCKFNTEENKNICTCNDIYFTDIPNHRCFPIPLRPGEPCDSGLEKLCDNINNTKCLKDDEGDFICKCIDDFITADGKCFLPPSKPGDICNPVLAPCDDVDGGPTDCKPTSDGHICACTGEFFTDIIGHKCVPNPTKPGQLCDPNNLISTCSKVNNSDCTISQGHYYCECRTEEYFSDTTKCVRLPQRPFEPCNNNTHCHLFDPNTECVPVNGVKVCACLPNFDTNKDGSKCLPRATQINGTCETDTQCTNVLNSKCSTEGFCTCQDGFVGSSTNSKCVEIVNRLGLGCEESIQCTMGIGENSTCSNTTNKCDCKSSFIGNTNKDQCLQISSINGDCVEPVQCTASLGQYSTCTADKHCNCLQYAGYLNFTCYRKVPLSGPCNLTEECLVGINEHAFCNEAINSTCSCQPYATPIRGLCFKDVSIGSDCKSDEECSIMIPYSHCDKREGICLCDEGRHQSIFGKCSAATSLKLTAILMLFNLIISLI